MPNDQKPWEHKPRSYMGRSTDQLPIKNRFLIVCEGEKTEPNYFKGFKIPKDSIVKVCGEGFNTLSLVTEAIRLRDQAVEFNEPYDQVWCVFDRDSFSAQIFNDAIQLARKNKILIAYSNEAFELWYVLHFNYLDTGITRKAYCDLLTRELKKKYEKNSENIYSEIRHLQNEAIQRAKRLYEQYPIHHPEKDKPSTTVHLLVEELNKLNWDNYRKKK